MPEPLVLVEDFAATTVVFRVYFWIEPLKTDGGKLKSQVMENAKIRLQAKHFALAGIPVSVETPPETRKPKPKESKQTEISSDTDELLREANRGRSIDHGDRLL